MTLRDAKELFGGLFVFVCMAIVAVLMLAVFGGGCADSTAAEITLTWTAPGDDDTTGTVAGYRVYYDTLPIDTFGFALSPNVPAAVVPYRDACSVSGPSGTPETCVIGGLRHNVLYYVRVTAVDSAGNWGAASNQKAIRAVDKMAPAVIILH